MEHIQEKNLRGGTMNMKIKKENVLDGVLDKIYGVYLVDDMSRSRSERFLCMR